MTASSRPAAQYIRMSTDKQDLSPLLQKEAIAAYAAARGMDVVASYEDEGRSGVHLKNRPALLRLLHDVTAAKQFATVLVYDVSRWGRFQDTDAAAYHEYHCKLHGVEVVYVAEMFGAEVNPITALLKSMKRAMAAEYSRDLANKSRAGQHVVIGRGYQMGPLPALGYRRCSVSADGQRQVLLDKGQRKFAATDRIKWVMVPDEVALVKRICGLYLQTRLSFADIARLGSVEGWRDHQGRPLSRRSIAALLRNEALIGNFVWGRSKHARSMSTCGPSRHDGCVPRLIDDETWSQIQRRTAIEIKKKQSSDQIVANLKRAFERSPLLTTRDLRAQGLPNKVTIRTRLGGWTECLEQAGTDPAALSDALMLRVRERRAHILDFGNALAERLREHGHLVTFNGSRSVLDFVEFRMRLRLLWPTLGEYGQLWRIRVDRISRDVDFDLLVRMQEPYQPKDFFVVPPAEVIVRFPQWLTQQIPDGLSRFWCRLPEQLLERIRVVTQSN